METDHSLKYLNYLFNEFLKNRLNTILAYIFKKYICIPEKIETAKLLRSNVNFRTRNKSSPEHMKCH